MAERVGREPGAAAAAGERDGMPHETVDPGERDGAPHGAVDPVEREGAPLGALAPGEQVGVRPHGQDALADAYAGKRVLLIGATGFLGGVTLSMLLARCPGIGRVFVLMRRSPGLSAAQRFRDRVLPSPVFDPIRARWDALQDRVTVLEGDLTRPDLGLDAASWSELAGQAAGASAPGEPGGPDGAGGAGESGLDLILNCAGLVEFEAPLDQAYRTNVLGVRHLLEVARRTGAHLVHVSTCFVAGSAAGFRPETVASGFFPRQEEAPYLDFDPEREVRDIEAELARVSSAVEEQAAQASYREQALERFRTQNAGLPSPSALQTAARRLQRDDLRARLVEAGRRRASFWGWPNVYTYSKSIGEQLIAASEGVKWSIARPAIIESALRFPEPGYNLNATTSAPLVMLALGGFRLAPARPDLVLDIVPVDVVASGILAIGAAALGAPGLERAASWTGPAGNVYQIGTSDVNPCRIDRVIELIGLYLHEREAAGNRGLFQSLWKTNREPDLVDRQAFEARTRRMEAFWSSLARLADDLRGRAEHPLLRALLGQIAERAGRTAEDLDKARSLWELFLPFSHDHDYLFESAAMRRLWAALGEPQDLETLDWRSYWLDVHIPGLRKHVLSESFGKQLKPVATLVSLPERIEAVARTDPYRAALTLSTDSDVRTLTYGEIWARAEAVAEALRELQAAGVTIAVDPQGHWIVGLLAAQLAGLEAILSDSPERAGAISRPARFASLELGEAGFDLKVGRRRRRGDFRAIRPGKAARMANLGPSALSGAAAVRWANEQEPVAARELARRLAEIGGWLSLEPTDSVLAPCSAPPGILLAPLYAQAELWIVPDERLPSELGHGGATRAVLTEDPVPEPGRVRAALDLAPQAGRRRLRSLLGRGIPVVPVRAEGLAASRLPDPEETGGDRLLEKGDGYHSLKALLSDDPEVEEALVMAHQAFIRPSLERFSTLREMVDHMQRRLRDLNARVPAADRLQALILTLGPLPDPPGTDSWEERTDWIRITPRSSRADWSGFPDDRIPLENLEDETVRLLRGWLDARSLAFVLAHHREGPRTYDRLLLLERVMVAMRRQGRPFNAQAFLQRYEQEAERTRSLEYRVGFEVGKAIQQWRKWHETEDPEGLLLPRAVTEPVKKGLGMATHAFFALAMDVSVRGQAYIPAQGSFVVVANHSSHLDTGVVKHALGAWGERIRALAAKDYFFGSAPRRFLAHHFTRLIPTDRQAVTTEWIKRSREALAEGDCILIFPEGTRTSDPAVGTFKASLGTLLRACRAPVLPIYIHGTHEILPKGTFLPRGRKIRVHIGPLIPYAVLEERTAHAAGTLARDREMAELVRRAVAGLEREDFFWLEQPPGRRVPALHDGMPPGDDRLSDDDPSGPGPVGGHPDGFDPGGPR